MPDESAHGLTGDRNAGHFAEETGAWNEVAIIAYISVFVQRKGNKEAEGVFFGGVDIRDRGKVEGATAMGSRTLGALVRNDGPVSWKDIIT